MDYQRSGYNRSFFILSFRTHIVSDKRVADKTVPDHFEEGGYAGKEYPGSDLGFGHHPYQEKNIQKTENDKPTPV